MRSPWGERDRGSVTAEFAVALPAIALVLAAALAQWAEDPLVCVSLSAPGAGLLAATERPGRVGRGIRESHLLRHELHRREAGRQHEGDRGQRDGELGCHAAPTGVIRP